MRCIGMVMSDVIVMARVMDRYVYVTSRAVKEDKALPLVVAATQASGSTTAACGPPPCVR